MPSSSFIRNRLRRRSEMSFKHIVDVGFVSTFYRRAPCRSWRICKTEIVIHVTFLNTCVLDVQFLYIAQFTMGPALRVWAGTEAEDLPGSLEVQRVLPVSEPSNRASCVLEDGCLCSCAGTSLALIFPSIRTRRSVSGFLGRIINVGSDRCREQQARKPNGGFVFSYLPLMTSIYWAPQCLLMAGSTPRGTRHIAVVENSRGLANVGFLAQKPTHTPGHQRSVVRSSDRTPERPVSFVTSRRRNSHYSASADGGAQCRLGPQCAGYLPSARKAGRTCADGRVEMWRSRRRFGFLNSTFLGDVA